MYQVLNILENIDFNDYNQKLEIPLFRLIAYYFVYTKIKPVFFCKK